MHFLFFFLSPRYLIVCDAVTLSVSDEDYKFISSSFHNFRNSSVSSTLYGLLFNSKNVGIWFLQSVGNFLPNYVVLAPKREKLYFGKEDVERNCPYQSIGRICLGM